MLSPTPRETLTDPQGRPYFLWDCDLTLADFETRLGDSDPQVRAYFIAKLMRQAKPDDVFQFVTLAAIEELWPRVERYLGESRAFWTWLLAELRVTDGDEVCIVDLVAEPTAAIDPPQRKEIEGAAISVDTMHEILVAKLTTLLGRTELRDLIDVPALLEAGGDLQAALGDAPQKDGGFSALTLAWVLESFDPRPLGHALGMGEKQVSRLETFKRELIEGLTSAARPASSGE